MAKTSYGYVERNLENDVNWAEVGKGFSDLLIAERDEREKKKEFLDDKMFETQEGIKSAPIGYNTDFNDKMSEFAGNSNSFVLAANKDLKAGKITPQQYMRMLNRINSGVDTVFSLANDFNGIYEDKLNRMDNKESGAVEEAAFEAMSKLVDFNNHDFMIDSNGTILAGALVTDENGVTSIDPNNTKSVQAIFNLAQSKVNRFDVDGEIQKSVKILGDKVLGKSVASTYSKEGINTVIKGLKLTNPDKYNEWRSSIVSRIMASDLDIASVIADYQDLYETTTDRDVYEKDKEKYIYVDITNGREAQVELTDTQREKAIEILEGAIDSQVGSSKETGTTAKIPPNVAFMRYSNEVNTKNIDDKTAATMLGYLYAGKNQADIDIASDYFIGLNKKIRSIKRNVDDIEILFENDNGQIDSTKLGYGSDFNMFIKGASLLTGKKDVSNAINKIDKANLNYVDGKYVFNKDVTSTRTRTVDQDSSYGNFLNEKIIPNKKESVNDALSTTLGTAFEVSEDGKSVVILDKRAEKGKQNIGKEYRYDSKTDMRDLRSVLRRSSSGESAFKVSQKNAGSSSEGESEEPVVDVKW